MTRIYQRDLESDAEPRMHALVLGIGRFPHLDNAPLGDRPACADSARAVVEFLVRNEDRFEAKLATIDCLISDPRNAADEDQIERIHEQNDPREDKHVDPGTKENVSKVFEKWLERPRQGDCYFFYCCSHGLAGRDERGLLVCEDYNINPLSTTSFLLNVGSLAMALPSAVEAGSVWIFMDACQEVLDELVSKPGGVGGIEPVESNLQKITRWPVKSTAIVAAQLGNLAYAPEDGGTAYFTQTLLHGLEKCCVESRNGKWFVTSRQIENTLAQLSDVLDVQNVETSRLTNIQPGHKLMAIEEPKIPVAVATTPETLMTRATQAEIKPRRPGSPPVETKNGSEATWRTELSLDERLYEVCLSYDGEAPRQQDFDLDPPSVFVRMEQ